MSDVFISYSREDKALVTRLHDALSQRERDIWVDWEGIPPTAEWLGEIFGAIDASEAFVFVLSPDSVASEVCAKELQHAVDQNKRLVPLVFRDAESALIPRSLQELNWIFIREQDDFTRAVDTLVEALDTDLERVKAHTRLLVRAREWNNREHHSLLMRARDLQEAERDFAGDAEREPKPTPLQLRYITASRKHATKVQRRILASVTVAMFVAITLAVVAWVQRQYSERRETAAIVRNIAPAKPMIALAQAVDAVGQWFSEGVPEVRSSLLGALQTPKERTIHIHECESKPSLANVAVAQNGSVAAALDPDPRFAACDRAGFLAVWDAGGKRQTDVAMGAPITALAGCSVEPIVLVVSADGSFRIRDLQDGVELQAAKVEYDVSVRSDTRDADRELDTYGAAPLPANADDLPGRDGLASIPNSGDPCDTYDLGHDRVSTVPVNARCSSGSGTVQVAALSADCNTIVIGRECSTEVWSRTPDLRRLWSVPETLPPRAIAIDESGRVIVRGYGDGSIRRATASHREVEFVDAEYARHPSCSPVDALAVSPDGASIASADGSTVRLWRNDAGLVPQAGDGFHGHEDRVTSLAFDPADGAFLVSGSRDNSIRVWDLAGNAVGEPLRGHGSWIRSVAIAPDSRTIVSGSNDGSARRWEVPRDLTDLPCGDPSDPIRVLAVTDDRETRLVQARGTSTNTWDLYTLDDECGKKLVAGGSGKQLGTLTPDGRFVAFADEGGRTIVLRDRTGDVEIPYPHDDLRAIAISAGGTALAFGGNDRIVRLWSREAGKLRELPIEHKQPIVSLAFGMDERFVASGSADNTVVLWDTKSGERIARPLQGHKGWISALAFSRDGRFVVTGSWDRTVRLWDSAGNPMGNPFRGHTDWITHVGFHPEDPSIISHGNDQRVGVWQGGDPGEWMKVSCRQLSRHPGAVEPEENEIYARAKSVCSRRGLLPQDEDPGDESPLMRAPSPKAMEGDAETQKKGITKFTESVDDSLERVVARPFLMPVEDVFSITGRGTFVTGRIEQGAVKVGEEIEIVGIRHTQTKVVIGVEMYRKVLDEAQAGDNVGVLLRGTKRDEVERGQVLAKPGSITPHTNFTGEVHMLTKEEGGRHAPFIKGYRPQFYFRTTDVPGLVQLPAGVEMVMPGDRVTLNIELTVPIAMDRGLRFAIREGGRSVGSGIVTEILD